MDVENTTSVTTIKHIRLLRSVIRIFGVWPGEVLGEKIAFYMTFFRKEIPIQSLVVVLGLINNIAKNWATLDFIAFGDLTITSLMAALTIIQDDSADIHGLTQQSVSKVCRRVARAILEKKSDYIKIQNHLNEQLRVMQDFESIVGFKNVVGAIDCTHIKVPKVNGHSGQYNINRKGYSSLNIQIYDITDSVSQYCTLFMITIMILTVILFNGPVLFYNCKIGAFSPNRPENISYYFAVHFLFPGYDPADHFILSTFVNIYFSFCCAFYVGGTSSLIYLMVFQIIAHIKVLIYNIEQLTSYDNNVKICDIDSPSADMYTAQHNRQIFQRLKECVEHHRSIVRFTADVSKVFGPLLGINYGYQLICCCLLLFECATGQMYAIARFAPIAIFIFGELVLVSVLFEVIKVESDKLSDAIYNIAWELTDWRNRKMVLFVLLQIQKPIFVTALGMTTIGVQTMAKILKTTFSYFIFLRSVDF